MKTFNEQLIAMALDAQLQMLKNDVTIMSGLATMAIRAGHEKVADLMDEAIMENTAFARELDEKISKMAQEALDAKR